MSPTIFAIRESILVEAERRYAALLQLQHVTAAERILLTQQHHEAAAMLWELRDNYGTMNDGGA